MLDFTLTHEQLDLQQKARDFALTEVLPVAWHYDDKDKTPLSVLKKAFTVGIMNTGIPIGYGGQGLGVVEGAILTEEVAAACPGLATSIFANTLGMEPIMLSANENAKRKYLKRLVNEFKLISFATSEPLVGSDVSGIRCRARADGEDYLLNGTKFWITNAGLADYITVFATADPQKSHSGIGAFVVETGWEGVSHSEPIPKMGQRTSNTVGIHFDNVRVPKANVLAPPGQGFVLAMKTFARTRPIIGAIATGAARSALDYALDYTRKRRAFGHPIADYQAVQFKIAEMFQKIETSRLLVYKAAWDADRGGDPTLNASISKFYATEAALEVVDEALQIFGGYGYTQFMPIEKLYRDTRVFKIYEGTSEIQRSIVAGHAMKGYQPVMPPLDKLAMLRGDAHFDESGPKSKSPAAWRCKVCGYTHTGDNAPDRCPYCFFQQASFQKVWG